MSDKHKYSDYKIENFIYLIIKEELKREELVSRVKDNNTNEELISKIIQKIDFAYKRISEPLENDIKYLLLVFPFGIVNRFNSSSFFDVAENRRLGFVKKVKEYNKYSFIGLIIYAIIIILTIIFFQIDKVS